MTTEENKRQLFLTTTDLDLVLLEPNDAATLAHWFNDHEVTKYLSRGDFPMTVPHETTYLEELYKTQEKLQLGVWHRTDKKLIGTVGMHEINNRDRKATFGITIGEKGYWSKGFGTQILQAMLDWAFNIRGLRHVDLIVLGNNPRGKRCYEKCGFTEVGRYPAHLWRDGVWHDEIHMLAVSPYAQ